MKQPSGARLVKSFLHLMSWFAANHGIEGAVSTWAAGKYFRTIPRNVNFEAIQALLDHCSSNCIRPRLGFSKLPSLLGVDEMRLHSNRSRIGGAATPLHL